MNLIKVFFFALFLSIFSGCSSAPPDEVIKEAITGNFPNPKAFQLKSWDEVNSYTRDIGGEKVYFIEYKAQFQLKPELKKYLNSPGGISFPHEFYDSTGEVSLVKRGSKWYPLE